MLVPQIVVNILKCAVTNQNVPTIKSLYRSSNYKFIDNSHYIHACYVMMYTCNVHLLHIHFYMILIFAIGVLVRIQRGLRDS